MKTFEDENFDILIGERISESEQTCPSGGYECLRHGQETVQPPAVSPEQIEQEVNELLRTHATALSRYALSLSWDRTTAQDGIQETFLRYFMARIRGQIMENPRAWLFRVLRNYLLDCNRRSTILPAVELKEAVQVADQRHDIETDYGNDETFRLALAALSPREQECMRLRLEGFGYDEIAQILQIRTGTVGALLARGLKKIRNAGFCSRRQ